MAPVLLCPECGTKHPLDNVAANASFPCTGCGRTLKVPSAGGEMARGGARCRTRAAPPRHLRPMRTPPRCFRPPFHSRAGRGRGGVAIAAPRSAAGIPALDLARERREAPADRQPHADSAAWVRFLLWLVAVPLAFLVVFGVRASRRAPHDQRHHRRRAGRGLAPVHADRAAAPVRRDRHRALRHRRRVRPGPATGAPRRRGPAAAGPNAGAAPRQSSRGRVGRDRRKARRGDADRVVTLHVARPPEPAVHEHELVGLRARAAR